MERDIAYYARRLWVKSTSGLDDHSKYCNRFDDMRMSTRNETSDAITNFCIRTHTYACFPFTFLAF